MATAGFGAASFSDTADVLMGWFSLGFSADYDALR
jgi:hypothetical protein